MSKERMQSAAAVAQEQVADRKMKTIKRQFDELRGSFNVSAEQQLCSTNCVAYVCVILLEHHVDTAKDVNPKAPIPMLATLCPEITGCVAVVTM